jgi:Flp pilus assembly pilin Flp
MDAEQASLRRPIILHRDGHLIKEAGIMMLFLPREEGQGLSEYALLLGFVALIVIVVVFVLGTGVENLYNTIIGSWPGGA